MNTTYFKNLIMNNLWKTGVAAVLPDTYYLGYSTTPPKVDGSNVNEPVGSTGYSRVPLTDLLSPAVDGVVQNKSQINMPEAVLNQGTITNFVLYDAKAGGNLLCGDILEKSRVMEAETTLIFKVSAIKISLLDKSV